MKYIYNLSILGILAIMCSACKTQDIKPGIIPPAKIVDEKPKNNHSLGIIGAVEPIYVLPMKTPFMARIDTGAETSSLDVNDLRAFERDGDKWVSFVLVNRESGEKHRFERSLDRHTVIKRINDHEKRPIVTMDIKFGDEIISAEFSLADRTKFKYQTLIGRNVITGRAIVDTSLENTLH